MDVKYRKQLISIIVPAFNEEGNIPLLLEKLNVQREALAERYDFEIIVLDNCSQDQTGELVRKYCASDSGWKYLRYSRNFGAEASMLAGLDHAAGNAVITVFSDLQDPPENIPTMLKLWEEGGEVICGIVNNRNDDSMLKRIGAYLAYKMIYFVSEIKIPPNATDFRLLDRKVVDALCSMREPDRYLRGLIHWVGFKQKTFTYDRAERKYGSSKGNLLFCVGFAFHAVLCFSSRPMRLSMIAGVSLTLLSVFASVVYLILFCVQPTFLKPPPPGLTTVILLVLFTLGMNSLFLGIIGEYIGRIYNQGKNRPLYVISEKVNI